jgi:hypothetical protein
VAEALMRGFRSTIALVAVALGLFAYVYFFESKRPEGEAETREKVFSAVDSDAIEEIRVKGATGEATLLRKRDGAWEVEEPALGAADFSEVSRITSNLTMLEMERVVDEEPAGLDEYGLAEPRVDVGFRLAGETGYRHLLIGDRTAAGGDLYARLGDSNRVFLIASYLDSTFDRTPFDLQDKAVLKFQRDDADSLEIAGPKDRLRATKSGDRWKLVTPFEAGADHTAVEGILGRLSSAQMRSVVEREATDLRQYGLDKPTATVTVGAGSSMATIAFGKDTGEGTVHARDTARPLVFTVDSMLLDDISKEPFDLRRKDVFQFRPYQATSMEISHEGQRFLFEKKADETDTFGKWRQVEPEAAEVDGSAMDTLLARFAYLRADSFAGPRTKTGLDSPVSVVVVKFNEGKSEERVAFGRSGEEIFVAIPGEPDAARIDAARFDEAIKVLGEVKK